MRPLGMAGDLRFLPRCELGVSVLQSGLGLLFQLAHFVCDRDAVFVIVYGPQLGDFAFELGDRLFEVEIGADCNVALFQTGPRQMRWLAMRKIQRLQLGWRRVAVTRCRTFALAHQGCQGAGMTLDNS